MTSNYKPVPRQTVEDAPPLTRQAIALWNEARDPNCTICPLHFGTEAGERCMFGNGPVPAAGMIVTDAPTPTDARFMRPLLGSPGTYLDNVLADVGVNRGDLYVTHAVKCLPPKDGKDKAVEAAVKKCVPFLEAELAIVKPKAVLAMGATAYYFFAHKKGIMKQRGQAFFSDKYDCWVIPTVHPTFVANNPTYDPLFISDITMFKRFMNGQTTDPPIDLVWINTLEDWRAAKAELDEDAEKILTFDLETRGFKDFDQPGAGYSQTWCAAMTRGRMGDDGLRVFVLPLEHPESPFLGNPLKDWDRKEVWCEDVLAWPHGQPHALRIADEYREIVEGFVQLILGSRVSGHNVKYDVRNTHAFARRYGIEV